MKTQERSHGSIEFNHVAFRLLELSHGMNVEEFTTLGWIKPLMLEAKLSGSWKIVMLGYLT